MVVKAVEPFREQSAGKAFYEQPSMDGSRPGIYYANLVPHERHTSQVYEWKPWLTHEGIPATICKLRYHRNWKTYLSSGKFGGYTAYIEGWGLYTELLPKEIGMYQDPTPILTLAV